MKVGDKVKHVNTCNSVYTILKLRGNIATLKRPKELIKVIKNPRDIVIDISICNVKNLIPINNENTCN